jgi:hypothetical protein
MTSLDRRELKGCKSVGDQHYGSFIKRRLPANTQDSPTHGSVRLYATNSIVPALSC